MSSVPKTSFARVVWLLLRFTFNAWRRGDEVGYSLLLRPGIDYWPLDGWRHGAINGSYTAALDVRVNGGAQDYEFDNPDLCALGNETRRELVRAQQARPVPPTQFIQ